MQHKELEVPPELRHFARGIWYRSMDFGPEITAFEVLPDGNAEVIFFFSKSCSLKRGCEIQPLTSPIIVGLLSQPIYFLVQRRLQVIGITCLPWAVYELFDLSTKKETFTTLDHPIAALQGLLQEFLDNERVEDALKLVNDWLIDKIPLPQPISVQKAGKAMLQTMGKLPVKLIASAANTTIRTLERKFKASSGYTVKDVSRLIRFEQARDRLLEQPDTSIIALACDLGYTDQSHLNREFKRYSGLTAAAFAKQAITRKEQY